jgi:hypothetical protein
VWTVALLGNSNKMAIGGDLAMVHIVDVDTKRDELMLPASECVFSITITEASLGFTNGSDVSLYGRSMPLKSWQEQVR